MSEPKAVHEQPSEWQRKIEGRWFGRPSLFDAQGNHVGYERVDRASVFENGVTTYYMDTQLTGNGPLRNRFELGAQFAFGVVDSDENRVYTGPDFYGTGQPYGTFVDAHYYSPGWQADLRTWNQILADGVTQVYSSVLYDGWAVCAVFNGIYQVAHDYDTNPDTKARIDAWLEAEVERGPKPQVLPTKTAGRWTGELEVVAADQTVLGKDLVTIEHTPLDLRRARQTVTWDGVLAKAYTFERYRDGARTQYDGPDVFGNAQGYGRALYTTQHSNNDTWKIKGREFLIDESLAMAVAWEHFEGDTMTHVVHGLLTWDETS
jgi:hypothetical protein